MRLARTRCSSPLVSRRWRPRGERCVKLPSVLMVALALSGPAAPVKADYKSEFAMSIVVNEEAPWGRAAARFAEAVRYRTQGRIQIKNYFDSKLLADRQTTEFKLLQQGVADFAIGSTINWSPQVKELNLFSLPFMFPTYKAIDAVQAGEPGKRLFKLIEQKGVIPIAWGENGFRELTNSKRPIRRPEHLQGLRIRVVGVPIFADIFRAFGANPVPMNFGEAVVAVRQGTADGQENPVWVIVPYRFWSANQYVHAVALYHRPAHPRRQSEDVGDYQTRRSGDRTQGWRGGHGPRKERVPRGSRREHGRHGDHRHPREDIRHDRGAPLAGRAQGISGQDATGVHQMDRGDRGRSGP